MLDSLTGFVVVAVAIAVGYIVGRVGLLGVHARDVLSRVTFFVLSPFLLFSVLAEADARILFSSLLPVSALAAAVVMMIFALVSWLIWRRTLGDIVIGSLSSGQVNANNIGLPLSLYLLGSAAFPAPVVLMQLLVFTPISLTLLDIASNGRSSFLTTLRRSVLTPIVLASVLGTVVSITGIQLPTLITAPIDLIADAAIPILLISYGMSLAGQRVLGAQGRRRDILLATVLKLAVMPLVAWWVAQLMGLDRASTLVVVVLAALPSAQNVFNYAQRYDIAEEVARDTVFLTTVGCIPVLLVITALLG